MIGVNLPTTYLDLTTSFVTLKYLDLGYLIRTTFVTAHTIYE